MMGDMAVVWNEPGEVITMGDGPVGERVERKSPGLSWKHAMINYNGNNGHGGRRGSITDGMTKYARQRFYTLQAKQIKAWWDAVKDCSAPRMNFNY